MKHKKILACFLTFSFLLTGCSTKDQSQSLSMTGTYFDTVVKILVWGADSKILDPTENLISQSLLPVIFGIFMIIRIIASLTQSSCPKQLLISIIKL